MIVGASTIAACGTIRRSTERVWRLGREGIQRDALLEQAPAHVFLNPSKPHRHQFREYREAPFRMLTSTASSDARGSSRAGP